MSNQVKEKIIVVSGIPPGASGTGRMIKQLMTKSAEANTNISFIHKARPTKPLRQLFKSKAWKEFFFVAVAYVLGQIKFHLQIVFLLAFGSGKLLLMHPQTLGFRLTVWLIKTWKRGKVYMYVLDASYFCVRSYNYVPHENQPCTACLGGEFSKRRSLGCQPFPVKDENAAWYVEQFFALGRAQRIKFLSQNKTQKAMLHEHFGAETDVNVVGLWGQDWTEPFKKWASGQKKQPSTDSMLIVFHGFYVPAKGAQWMIDVAKHCPDLDFLCAHPKPAAVTDAPPNMEFKNLTWETGLEQEVENAFMVMVPSLWSAPIEGALIKSIVSAQRVGIVQNESAFQNEVPDSIVLRLPKDPEKAAKSLSGAVKNDWRADGDEVQNWLQKFQQDNQCFIDSMIKRILQT